MPQTTDARPTLPVLFRRDRGEVVAVFPTLPADHGGSLTCYAHVGQHGSCDRGWLRDTRRATAAEAAPLLAELRRIYEGGDESVRLVPMQRQTAAMRRAFNEGMAR